jgi:hypothetical protein
VLNIARLPDHRVVYDKPSKDGSAKLNVRAEKGKTVWGVLYRIDLAECENLRKSEGGYRPRAIEVEVEPKGRIQKAISYCYEDKPHAEEIPYDWYLKYVVAGACFHRLSEKYLVDSLIVVARPDSDEARRMEARQILARPPNLAEKRPWFYQLLRTK